MMNTSLSIGHVLAQQWFGNHVSYIFIICVLLPIIIMIIVGFAYSMNSEARLYGGSHLKQRLPALSLELVYS